MRKHIFNWEMLITGLVCLYFQWGRWEIDWFASDSKFHFRYLNITCTRELIFLLNVRQITSNPHWVICVYLASLFQKGLSERVLTSVLHRINWSLSVIKPIENCFWSRKKTFNTFWKDKKETINALFLKKKNSFF